MVTHADGEWLKSQILIARQQQLLVQLDFANPITESLKVRTAGSTVAAG
jgi:hypothetical protein